MKDVDGYVIDYILKHTVCEMRVEIINRWGKSTVTINEVSGPHVRP